MDNIEVDIIKPPNIEININGNIYTTTGSSGNDNAQLIAGENISGNRMIYIKDGKAFYADANNTDCLNKVIGMSLNAATINDTVNIRTFGKINNPNWGLIQNANYLLNTNGEIYLGGDNNFTQIIGFAIDSENLFIKLQIPIKRN